MVDEEPMPELVPEEKEDYAEESEVTCMGMEESPVNRCVLILSK